MRDLGAFRALDHAFRLEVDESIAAGVADLFGGLAASDARPATTYAIAAGKNGDVTLRRDGTVASSGSLHAVLQMLVTLVGNSAIEGPITAVHGTTVVREGRGVLLAGPTGRGKSTLAAYLLTRGWSLVAEDISALDDGRVRAYHRPLGLSPESVQLIGGPLHERADDLGPRRKRLVRAEQLGGSRHGLTPVTVVAVVDRTSTTIAERTPAAMLAHLLEVGAAWVPDLSADVSALIGLLATSHCIVIGSEDVAAASAHVEELCGRPVQDAPSVHVESQPHCVTVYCGGEAVLVERDRPTVHHLNMTATAVWALHSDGLSPAETARELGAERVLVDATLAELDARGLIGGPTA